MEVAPFKMEVAPFFVEFHNLHTFVAIYIMSRFTHFFRNFFWPNSLLRNITRFLHVWRKGAMISKPCNATYLGHRDPQTRLWTPCKPD